MDAGMEKKALDTTTFRYWLAGWVSIIIHPIAFPLFTLGAATFAATHSLPTALRLTVLALALTSLPVTALVSYQVLSGKWSDLDVSVRQQRYALYPFGLACTIALALVFARINAPRIAIGATLALVVSNVVDGIVNFVYKVSAHATSAAACAVLLWASVPAWGVPAAIAALAVGWSRVVLGRHTPGQVLLGWTVGVSSTLAAIALAAPAMLHVGLFGA